MVASHMDLGKTHSTSQHTAQSEPKWIYTLKNHSGGWENPKREYRQ